MLLEKTNKLCVLHSLCVAIIHKVKTKRNKQRLNIKRDESQLEIRPE